MKYRSTYIIDENTKIIKLDNGIELKEHVVVNKNFHYVEYLNEDDYFHNPIGPARIRTGLGSSYKEWYFNGEFHRLDGPAIEFEDGEKMWYINGSRIPVNSQEEFERYIRLLPFK